MSEVNLELYNYQKYTVDKAAKYFEENPVNGKFNIFFKMGLGKTLTSIELINRLHPKTVLIVCPKSLIEMWEYNIHKYCKYRYTTVIDLKSLTLRDLDRIIIVNYEQLLRLRMVIFPDLCIFDEVHKLKNYNSKTHKVVATYIKPNMTLCLTGTPITKDLMDIFGISTCVGKQEFLGLTPTRFHYKYIIRGGSKAYDELMTCMKNYTVFMDYDEADVDGWDMPSTEDIIIPIKVDQLTRKRLYDVYTSDSPTFTKISQAVRITSECNSKQNKCIELIDDLISDNKKVVVFCRFTDEFNWLMDKYQDICVGINGATKEREQQVLRFQNDPKIKIFIGNLQTVSYGLTLTAAHHAIFYSQTDDWGAMDQAKARIARITQNHNCTYYHLLIEDSIDEIMYLNNLQKTSLVAAFENYLKEKY